MNSTSFSSNDQIYFKLMILKKRKYIENVMTPEILFMTFTKYFALLSNVNFDLETVCK